jgi:hypothetical protein
MDEEYLDEGGFSTPEQYGQSYAPGGAMSNLGFDTNIPEQSYAPNDFDSLQYMQNSGGMPQVEQYDQSFAPGSAGYNMQQTVPSWGMSTPGGDIPNNQGGIQQTLADIFNNKKLMTGLGAGAEGLQNLMKMQQMKQLASKMQGAMDPFGSQRPMYQQQLQQAIQNPYGSPIVRDQVAQIQRAQAAKDAAAGRRSNSATSSPAMLAAQAQVAQQYINSLMQPAGANISPSSLSSLIPVQQSGINAGINNVISPALSAAGYSSGTNNNQAQFDALKKFLTGG